MKTNGTYCYEDAAEKRAVTGWVCKTCRRYWGDDEHMARYCCAKDLPCKCGKRIVGSWTACEDCRNQKQEATWANAKKVEWDGTFPVCEWDNDKFFWCEDSIRETCIERGIHPRNLRLVKAEPCTLPEFELHEFLRDELADDQDITGADAIDKTVNDFIDSLNPLSYWPTGEAIDSTTLADAIGWTAEDEAERAVADEPEPEVATK